MSARVYLTFFLFPALLRAQAQPPSLSHHYRQPDGTIYSLLQDSKGFMWFGTSLGLVRYDGYTFTTYTHQPDDSTTLSDSFIREIAEDREGFLWVSTLNGGLNRFNPATAKAMRLYDIVRDEAFLKEKSFSSLAIDPEGYVWAGASQLYRIHPQHFTVEKFHIGNDPFILAIMFTNQNEIWLGTNGNGFGKYDPATQKFERITLSHSDPVINERVNVIRSMSQAPDGHIWLGTYGGLVRYHPHTKSLQHWTHNPTDAGSLPHNSIWNVIATPNNRIWISTWGGGVTFFDVASGQFKNEYFRPGGLLGMEALQFPGLYLTENGYIWAGTNGSGIHKINLPDEVEPLNIPFKVSAKIYRIIQIRNWSCLISETEGIYLYKAGSADFFKLTYASTPGKLALSGNRVNGICERRNGTVYFATENGLTAFDPLTQRITMYRRQPGNPSTLNHNDVIALTVDEDDRLWIGTPFGLSRLNDDGTSFTRYTNDLLPATSITALTAAGDYILIGTSNQGLFILNRLQNEIITVNKEKGLSNNYVTSLCADEKGIIWAGTSDGLNRIDFKGRIVGKPGILAGSTIRHIVHTPQGMVAATNKGFFLTAENGPTFSKANSYDLNNLLYYYFENTPSLVLQLPSGLFTLPVIAPEKKAVPLPVLLTRFELAANSPNPLPEEEAALHPAYRNSITLEYNQNFFSIEFALLDFTQPDQHRYAYRLNGFDRDWNFSENRRFTSYTNIPPGTYVLQLKASGSDESWHVNPSALSITILPPWWKTPWAYIGYVVAGISLLWLARRQVVNRERLKAQVLIAQRERQALQEVDHLKTQFFSNITHEFRTPLTLIQGPAEDLMQRTQNSDDKHLLEVIKNNTQRLLQLINQLLDISRLDAQQLSLEENTVDLSPWLRSLISQFTSLAQNRHITFQWHIVESLPVVKADEKKLESILTNLISNAIKFTSEGGKVSVYAVWQAGLFTFRVADTGCGIPPKDLPHIFNRFYQVQHPHAHKAGGTGIGLTLVKEYTELMKGTIHVESTVGSGSTFSVSLPLQKTDAVSEMTTEPLSKLITEKTDTDDMKLSAAADAPLLLLVEDNTEIRQLLRSSLGNQYRYEEANHGKEGWDKAIHTIPDLIISDLMMPEMDGMELCAKIKSDVRTQHIPFLMLTAKAGEENKLSGLQTGADDYLVKPFNRSELVARVHNLLQLRDNIRRRIKNTLLTQAAPVQVTSADEQFILKARRLVEDNLNNPQLSVEWLAENLNMGREQCYRKMMGIAGISPSAFIRKIRLQRAAQLLGAKWGPVSQVAYEVGYENLSHFSKAFKEEFGRLPSEYAD